MNDTDANGSSPLADERPAGPLSTLLADNLSATAYVAGLFTNSRVLTAHLGEPGKQWQSAILPFCRWLKAHPYFAGLSGKKAWKEVSRIVSGWERDGERWELHFGTDAASAEVEFLHWWLHMRSLPTADPLEYAYQRSKDDQRRPHQGDTDRRASTYPAFISFCYHLQHNVGPRTPIYLPLGRLAELFGLSEKAISIHRKQAVEDGYLTPKAPAVHRPGKGGLAASFLFDLSRWKHPLT